MNPQLASDLAACHARDLRRGSEQHRRRAHARALTTADGRRRPSPLRRQIGFKLMEAGLRLVATAAD
jgi:hypothetical protein